VPVGILDHATRGLLFGLPRVGTATGLAPAESEIIQTASAP